LIDDRFYEACLLSGRLLAADGRFADAEPQLHRATELRPDDRAVRLEHARAAIDAWIRGGRKDTPVLDRALASASAAIASDSRDAAAYVVRARVHLARGAHDSAITDASLALGITKSADAHKVRAEAHAARGDWAAAASDFAGAGERREKARALARAKKFAEARAEYDELLKQDPSDASLALERGRAILASGDADGAATAADAILERSPAVTLARVLRADALLSKDDVAGAIAEASRAYDEDPTQPDALIIRARAFAKKGDKTNARRDLEKAKELAPASRVPEIESQIRALD
jgi:tetratricopeptide (TPR) repeat protein